jgi:starvation-inducible DNA-binding protein
METLVQQLRVILGTNFSLYFKAHSFHWNVEGPNFNDYHAFLGALYNQIWANTDLIAEKLRMLGVYAPPSLGRLLEYSDVSSDAITIPDARMMFMELKVDNDRMITNLRAGIDAADEANEPAIGNFLQDLLDQHQKHAWMINSLLK